MTDATWTSDEVLREVLVHLAEIAFIAEIDVDGDIRVVAMRGRTQETVGITYDDVLGRPIEEFMPGEAAERAHEMWPRALDGELVRYTGAARWPAGVRSFEVVVWATGDGRRVAGVARDRTAEDRALHRLREREALSRGVLDAIESGTAVVDAAGRIIAVNAEWVRRTLDASGAAIATGPGDDYLAELDGDLPDVADGIRLVLSGGVDGYEADHQVDGRWWTLRVRPIELDDRRGAVVTHLDITERVLQEQALRAARDRWETAFEHAGTGMALVSAEGRFQRVNRRLCEVLGRDARELVGEPILAFVHPDDRHSIVERGRLLLAGGVVGEVERRFVRPDGTVRWLHATSAAVGDGADGAQEIYIQYEDVTDRKHAEARLEDHRRLLELVATGTPTEQVLHAVVEVAERHLPGTRCGIATGVGDSGPQVVVAPRLTDEYVAAVAEKLGETGWLLDDDLLVTADLVHDPRTVELATVAVRHGVQAAWVAPVRDERGHVVGLLGAHDRADEPDDDERAALDLLVSVVEVALGRDRAQQRLARKSLEDPLTGLPNRALFVERLDQAVARLGTRSRGLAVMAVDVDRFSRVNAGLGHRGGDEALAIIGRRLVDAVPAPDTVARSGGDEFLILCEDVADEATALDVAERARAALSEPMFIDGMEVRVTASVGVTVHAGERDVPDDLERDAHTALAAAKAAGRARCQLFRPSQRRGVLPGLALENQLRAAVAERQFSVHFQPEVSLADGRLVGVEALVRWHHPDLGLLAPSTFIDAAEETGAIVEIGRIVLDEAVRNVAAWSRTTGRDIDLAVNLSARQLEDPDLLDHVAKTLERHGFDPHRLMFEITESVLVEDAERTIEVFRTLRDLGVRLAIDDFGTGYSTLLYLKRFPADVVKIDRSFVDGLGQDTGDSAIVAAVVRLAHELDLQVIAEGVETAEQLAHLRQLGCEQGQGFLWSKPLPPAQAEVLVRDGLPPVDLPEVEPLAVGVADRSDAGTTDLDELLAVLSHELSTPLTVIGGYAEMLHARLAKEEAEQLLPGVAAIERNVHNLARLVTALADARGGGGGAGADAVTFDLVAFVAQTLTDLVPILGGHEVRLDARVPSCDVRGDAVGLRQVLTNLLGNAAKFAPAGSPIEVVVDRSGDVVEVAVVDHGPGVPPERAGELFGRFSRLGSTRKGLGLGLYLSRTIARRHGGDVVHRPTPGGGATFAVSLPAAGVG